MELPLYHKRQLERDVPEVEPDIDHEREARIYQEAKHVTEGDL